MIFAVLKEWYHHIVLTHSFKLVSFFIYICCFIAKSLGISLTRVRSAIARPVSFTIYLFKAKQYTSGRVQTVECVYHCCCCFYFAAAHYTWKSGLAVVDFDPRHLIAELLTRTSVRCKDLGDICCTSRGILHFVLTFVAMATRVGRGKIWLSTFSGPFLKTSGLLQSWVIANFVPNLVAMATGVGRRKMQLAAFNAPSQKSLYRCKNLADISYTKRVIANFVSHFVAMSTGVNRG